MFNYLPLTCILYAVQFYYAYFTATILHKNILKAQVHYLGTDFREDNLNQIIKVYMYLGCKLG